MSDQVIDEVVVRAHHQLPVPTVASQNRPSQGIVSVASTAGNGSGHDGVPSQPARPSPGCGDCDRDSLPPTGCFLVLAVTSVR